ncbi:MULTISPECIES: AraC family transcriptional regulator [Flavobacterium]|jgi:AraC-like DNA-binding protein|uniref:AraC family transcriptional regulator n=1 Tax=Flavobacterium cupriresistens TaxID=2893885 RepID=A0ABU4RKB1_9FLAO|nr:MULTISPECIES: AraC family transcriptional regulator [unclassified Flavobacterium]KLT69019.1 AraC family transcriptional regulator [Flavobacterium sp. ABG]MDX6190951.1 AraC family transcriptional regulator [Flavobacterium sp. Fl-318]UFH43877.1 AraC family transcriptional regulator [Flavobacterium sp. F-323]
MEQTNHKVDKYYIKKVDADQKSIYCHHDVMGELFVPTHKHDKAQLLYAEGDVVFVTTETKTYFLPARHFIWIPGGVEHSIHPKSENVMMRNLYFPVEKNENDFYQNEGIYPVNNLLLQMMLFTNQWNGDLKDGSPNFVIAKAIKAILPQICLINLPLELPLPKDPRLGKILRHIENNLGETILFAEVAHEFGYSERSLYRLFQKDLKMSFIQYYTIRRILKAIELLLERKLSVKEVAQEVGYNSVPTFSNTFFKILGQRPSDYLGGEEILVRTR